MDRTTTIDVTGMTCNNCVAHVTEELQEVPHVLDVTVELRTGEPSKVTVVSDQPLDEQALRAAVDEAGYTATAVH
ncbi:MAG TPA: heavy metal-associated domain-containing protein [Beutenbergiaceae bacterium]|nr:heavy metal-associated domain-containing protein [Beutenbergiaceae bacterium]